jgi:GDP-L-fucose synthase
MNKTLITGSNGLVGSQFKGDIIAVTSKVCDLRQQKSVNELFEFYTNKELQKDYYVDKVIHCAGKVGGVKNNMLHKGEFYYDNIMMNTNVIEASRIYGIKKLVVFLSTCIFPDNIEYPLTEDKIHLGAPHPSNDGYAYAKRMGAVQIQAYREQYGLDYKAVIPTNIYGINDNFNVENGHVIPSLIHKCYLARENKTDFIIWGSGNPLREFIYNKDIAKLTEWVLNEYNESTPIILGNSIEISIKDVVDLIVKQMNYKGNVIFDTSKPEGQFRKPSDNSKIMSYLPNFKFTPIEEGLKETIDWFEKNYENIRK